MSPRPRTVEDADILMACQRVMQRVGPAQFTLALVAKEAGLAPATIVQRFGSKRALLRTLSGAMTGQGAAFVDQLRARFPSPLQVLREFLLCWAQMASTPREMANHLAYLQMDLTDPVMLENLAARSRESLGLTAALLREAHVAEELVVVDADGLARALNATVTGGLLAWATFREGSARDWLARDLDVLLSPLSPDSASGGNRD